MANRLPNVPPLPQLPQRMSLMDAFMRNAANAATFGAADNISAAANATLPMGGAVSQAPGWFDRYQADLAAQKAADAMGESQHGNAWQAGDMAGWMMNPAQKIPMVQGILGLTSGLPSMLAQQSTDKRPAPQQGGIFGGLFGPGGALSRFNGY